MTTRDPNIKAYTFAKAVQFAVEEGIKAKVRTMVPGIVQSYDPETKRAKVLPALRRVYVGRKRPSPQAILLDVPIVTPATGGFMIHQQIRNGDMVMVLFCERGIQEFKKKWDLSDPTPGHFYKDAVAIRWGIETISPVSDEGIVLQNEYGTSYIHITDDEIRMKVGNGNLRLTSDNFDAWKD